MEMHVVSFFNLGTPSNTKRLMEREKRPTRHEHQDKKQSKSVKVVHQAQAYMLCEHFPAHEGND